MFVAFGAGVRVFEVMWETAPQKTDDFCTNICKNLSSGNIWHSHKFNEDFNLKNDLRKIPAFGSPRDYQQLVFTPVRLPEICGFTVFSPWKSKVSSRNMAKKTVSFPIAQNIAAELYD